MAIPEEKIPIKLMVDTKRNKVLFAEAGNDFVDVLLSFLTLPLGTIIRRLNEHFGGKTQALGCFNNLYLSITKLNESDFVYKEDKHILLHPKNASQSELLKLNVDDSELTKYYKCRCIITETFIAHKACRACGRMNFPVKNFHVEGLFTSCNGRVFSNSEKSFIVTDNLHLKPGLDGLNIEQIQNLASDVDEFDEKIVDIGLYEVLHLLNLSLLSPTPLTNLLFLPPKPQNLKQSNFPTLSPSHEISYPANDSVKMVIKLVVQKSTKKLLFFVAGEDFVGLLFNLLSIPLGTAASLLSGNASLGSIDNLYSSISELSSEYLVSKECLLNPNVVHQDTSTNLVKFLSFDNKSGTSGLDLMDLMFHKGLMKGTSTFMVTDDLIVTPLSSISIMSHLKSCEIHVSDVRELVYNIGTKEVFDIFKASITSSTSALSNSLQLMKQPKQEK